MNITEICAALCELEDAREKATPGPWKWSEYAMKDSHGMRVILAAPCGYENPEVVISDVDRDFIVASRNCPISFRKISDVVRALETSIDAMKANVWHIENTCKGAANYTRNVIAESDRALTALEVQP